jgi:hypothetical protein
VAGYAVNGPQWALRSGLGLGRWEEAPKPTVLVGGHIYFGLIGESVWFAVKTEAGAVNRRSRFKNRNRTKKPKN